MTSSHFVIPYTGNKYKEYQKHYKSYLNFDGIKTVIEPFSGSCAMSFLIWKEIFESNNDFLILYETSQIIKKTIPDIVLNYETRSHESMCPFVSKAYRNVQMS